MLSKPYLLAMLDLQELIANTTDSRGHKLDDLCYKPIRGKGCIIESPLNYWRSNRTAIEIATPRELQLATACVASISSGLIPCLSKIGALPPRARVRCLPSDALLLSSSPSSSLLLCVRRARDARGRDGRHRLQRERSVAQPLRQLHSRGERPDPDVPAGEHARGGCARRVRLRRPVAAALTARWAAAQIAEEAKVWEKEVFLRFAEEFKAKMATPGNGRIKADVTYMAQRSVQDAIAEEESQNAFVVIISYIAMFLYISLALGKFPNPVRSRSLLGLLGIFLVIASVGSALGMCSFFGTKVRRAPWPCAGSVD